VGGIDHDRPTREDAVARHDFRNAIAVQVFHDERRVVANAFVARHDLARSESIEDAVARAARCTG
jgi:hypothetical protein